MPTAGHRVTLGPLAAPQAPAISAEVSQRHGEPAGAETWAAAAGRQQGSSWQHGHPGRSPVALAACLYLPGHLLKVRSPSQCP